MASSHSDKRSLPFQQRDNCLSLDVRLSPDLCLSTVRSGVLNSVSPVLEGEKGRAQAFAQANRIYFDEQKRNARDPFSVSNTFAYGFKTYASA